MAQPSQSARKWNGFVCPDCRHVFRVARDHDGWGVVCPSCNRMLRLPGAGDEVPPLVVQGHVADHEQDKMELLTGEPDEHGHVKKRRRNTHKPSEVFDETFARKEELNPKLVRGLIGSVALFGVILVVALLWPSGEEPDAAGSVVPIPVEKEGPEKDELAIKAELSTVKSTIVEGELLPVFEKFLNAQSPEEMAKWVRHPEVSLPRIKSFYGEDFSPDGFSSITWANIPERTGDSIRVTIQDGTYREREIHLVDEDGWKVDWESWAGWSEMSWDEFKESRTTEPVLFRVVVSDVDYYNFSFVDDAHWSSYRIEPFDGEDSLFAYVPRGGVVDARLKSLDGIKDRLFILKLRYPDEATSESQVLVEEVVAEGWLAPDDAS